MITITKKEKGIKWLGVEKGLNQVGFSQMGMAYPTSSKSNRDWSHIEKNVEKSFKDDEEAGDPFINVMKTIY